VHLIILPGNSKQYNEKWLEDSAAQYSDLFESVTKHVYDHWQTGTGEEHADMRKEAEKLAGEASALGGEYIVMAKSIGVPTVVRAVIENRITPTKCVFLGSAFEGADENFIKMASKFKVPALFIEQTDDMFFPYAELKKFLETNWTGEYKLIEIPGGNHAYDNYDQIKWWVGEFLK
jgi:hypothetical protein